MFFGVKDAFVEEKTGEQQRNAAFKVLTVSLIKAMSCKPVHSMVQGKICLDLIRAHDETNLVSIPGWTMT